MFSKSILAVLAVLFQVSVSSANIQSVCAPNDGALANWLYVPSFNASAGLNEIKVFTRTASGANLGPVTYSVSSWGPPTEGAKRVVEIAINNTNSNKFLKGMKITKSTVYYLNRDDLRINIGIYQLSNANNTKQETIVVDSKDRGSSVIYSSGYGHCVRQ